MVVYKLCWEVKNAMIEHDRVVRGEKFVGKLCQYKERHVFEAPFLLVCRLTNTNVPMYRILTVHGKVYDFFTFEPNDIEEAKP